MRRILICMLLLCSIPALAQVDRHDVRSGNRKFRRDDYKNAEIDYRKAVVKDSMSVAGQYDLASTLYRQEDYENAGKALETIKDVAASSAHAKDYYYNLGDVALQKKDYGAAMEAFKQALLRDPSDMDAKENYIYAKLMKQDEDQNGGGGGGGGQNDQDQQNQDQNQNGGDNDEDKNDQNQNQQDQNQDQQNQDNQNNQQNQGDQPQSQGQQPQESKISPQQAQQMLQAIQAKEKETQDKVKKEKADLLQSKQKEKNW